MMRAYYGQTVNIVLFILSELSLQTGKEAPEEENKNYFIELRLHVKMCQICIA